MQSTFGSSDGGTCTCSNATAQHANEMRAAKASQALGGRFLKERGRWRWRAAAGAPDGSADYEAGSSSATHGLKQMARAAAVAPLRSPIRSRRGCSHGASAPCDPTPRHAPSRTPPPWGPGSRTCGCAPPPQLSTCRTAGSPSCPGPAGLQRAQVSSPALRRCRLSPSRASGRSRLPDHRRGRPD